VNGWGPGVVALIMVGAGTVVLVLAVLLLIPHVRRFFRERAALRASVGQRVAALRALRDARAQAGSARRPTA
jgi:hypothetical protein